MRRPRFTIRSLLSVVLFVGVAVAALRASTGVWDCGLFGATLLVLLTAVLLAVHRTDRSREFWLGFALFGWAYLIASMVPSVESRLPTTKGLAYLDSFIRPRPWVFASIKSINTGGVNWAQPSVSAVAFSPDGRYVGTPSPDGTVRLWDATTGTLLVGPYGTSENFLRIGHSLLALVLAFVGGHLSRCLYGQGREDRTHPPINPPASP